MDLVDGRFALFAGPEAVEWAAAATETALPGISCAVFRTGGTVGDPDGGFCEAIGISPSGAVLVRPDNVVAWRAAGAGATPAATMARVFDAMLGRAAVAG